MDGEDEQSLGWAVAVAAAAAALSLNWIGLFSRVLFLGEKWKRGAKQEFQILLLG